MAKKGNFIVINGIRYDVVPDGEHSCTVCDLRDTCFVFLGFLCRALYSPDIHFEKR